MGGRSSAPPPTAGAPRARALEALRRLSTGAGEEALAALAPVLFAAAAEAPGETWSAVEAALRAELLRAFGSTLGEKAPASIEEAALRASDSGATPEVRRARRALLPLLTELQSACEELLSEAGAPALTERALAALDRAEQVLERAVMAAGRFTAPAALRGRELQEPGRWLWDPLAAVARLRRSCSERRVSLGAELSRRFAPLSVAEEEALRVGLWCLGRGPAPRCAALLKLASALDGYCARAPLGAVEREELLALARAADLERGEPEWGQVAARVLLLRRRLVGGQRPLKPLYRKPGQTRRRSYSGKSLVELLSEPEG